MPGVTRLNDNNTGHDQCSAVPLVEGSPNVFCDGLPVGRVNDKYDSHGCIAHPSHQDYISAGSSTVFVNGLPIARKGDPVEKGGSVDQASSTVFAG